MANMVRTRIIVDPPQRLQDVAQKVGRGDEWCADFAILLPEPEEHQQLGDDPFSSEAYNRAESLRDWRTLYWGCDSTAGKWSVDTTSIRIETKWTSPLKWLDALSIAFPDISLHIELDLSENEAPNESFTLIDGVCGPVAYIPYVSEWEHPLSAVKIEKPWWWRRCFGLGIR